MDFTAETAQSLFPVPLTGDLTKTREILADSARLKMSQKDKCGLIECVRKLAESASTIHARQLITFDQANDLLAMLRTAATEWLSETYPHTAEFDTRHTALTDALIATAERQVAAAVDCDPFDLSAEIATVEAMMKRCPTTRWAMLTDLHRKLLASKSIIDNRNANRVDKLTTMTALIDHYRVVCEHCSDIDFAESLGEQLLQRLQTDGQETPKRNIRD
jgi:hypothetical protein